MLIGLFLFSLVILALVAAHYSTVRQAESDVIARILGNLSNKSHWYTFDLNEMHRTLRSRTIGGRAITFDVATKLMPRMVKAFRREVFKLCSDNILDINLFLNSDLAFIRSIGEQYVGASEENLSSRPVPTRPLWVSITMLESISEEKTSYLAINEKATYEAVKREIKLLGNCISWLIENSVDVVGTAEEQAEHAASVNLRRSLLHPEISHEFATMRAVMIYETAKHQLRNKRYRKYSIEQLLTSNNSVMRTLAKIVCETN